MPFHISDIEHVIMLIRDLKSSNILLTQEGVAKIADVGKQTIGACTLITFVASQDLNVSTALDVI